jgi:hypothetical protein
MATAAPLPQGNPPDPQIVTESSRTATNVNRGTLLRNDPATAAAYANYQTSARRALTEKYLAEGASLESASIDAAFEATAAANQQFAPQIVAAGAGTFTNTTNPLLPQQPQPPSGPVTPVNPAANPQAPAAAPTPPPGRPLLPLRDDGSGFNRQIGDVREDGAVLTQFLSDGTPVFVRNASATNSAVSPTANPQVPDGSLPEEQASPAASAAPVNPAANPQVQSTSTVSLEQQQQQLSDSVARSRLLRQQLQQQDDIIAGLNGPRRRAPPGLTALAGSGSVPVQLARAETRKKILEEQLATEDGIQRSLTSGKRAAEPVAAPPPPPARARTVTTTASTVAETALATQQQNTRDNARAQAQLQAQRAQAAAGDWRLKLRLAPGSDYLYNAGEPGILQPLKVTEGVIFPYTPTIATTYTAQYNNYELTHSNYRGYFYQGSHVGELTITATFTAQDSNEAAYLLAVIQFFRSVTKMFYGQQDAFRGSPPPLVFLQGYGEFQFNLNPCVVQTFNYTLPADVDYIRAGAPNIDGTSLLQRRDRQTTTVGSSNPSTGRMSAAGLSPGGTRPPPPPVTLGRAQPTYVPTKMEMTIVLLPMQTRSQVSREFSMENFANGSLVQRGFW